MLTYLSRDFKFCFLSSLFAIDLKSQVSSYRVFLFLFFFLLFEEVKFSNTFDGYREKF